MLAALTCATRANAQDFEWVRQKFAAKSVTFFEAAKGKRIIGVIDKKFADGRRERFDFDLVVRDENTWRLNRESANQTSVRASNGDYTFGAARVAGEYHLVIGGFDALAREKIIRGLVTRVPNLQTQTHVFGVPLGEFLEWPGLVLESLEPKIEDGRETGVEFGYSFPGSEGKTHSFGKISLNGNADIGFLVENVDFNFGTRESPVEGRKYRSACTDITIPANTRKLARKCTEQLPEGLEISAEIVSIEDESVDDDYFTPESIGLETPQKPFPFYYVWLALGSISASLAISSAWRYFKKQQA